MSDIELVAIVNSYNRLELLKTAMVSLAKALKQVSFPSGIVIFEAGSRDGSREWISSFIDSTTDLPIDCIYPGPADSTSFSAGVNSACMFAHEKYKNLKWYFLFETDNWVDNGKPIVLATELLASEEKLAAVGFTVSGHDGKPKGYGSSFPTLGEFLLGQELTHKLKLDSPMIKNPKCFKQHRWWLCDVVFTSPLVVKRAAWEAVGGLDQEAFPFSECDIDWAWRLNRQGFKLAVLETSSVVHDNQRLLSDWSDMRVLHFHKARLKLLRRHVGPWVDYLKPLLLIRHLFELVLLSLSSGFVKHRPGAIKRRQLLIERAMHCYEE